jgi:hypothetical protein
MFAVVIVVICGYSALTRRDGSSRVDGLFRTDPTGSALHMAASIGGDDRIEAFAAVPGGSATIQLARYRRSTIVSRRHTAIGPLAEFLDADWQPLRGSGQPEFGFHQLP